MNAEALIGTVLGTCTLQKLIGQGGMGAVFLAQQSRPRRQVAVKVLLPMVPLSPNQLAAFLERFRRETDAAASLEHPNIMPVHEYGERDGVAYLVMPYISGGTLRDEMEREDPLSLEKAVNYLDQMAAALDFAHERGVIHRDIKPANILMTPEGRLLLTDFGLVKIISEDRVNQVRLTGAGAPVGTPDYMAPEQVIGESVDARADLYSLGVILFQMVTGTTPFQGETPMQIAAQHLQVPPPAPQLLRPELPVVAEQVILRALAKRPGDRYQTAQELAQAFRMALVGTGIQLSMSVPQSGLLSSATNARLAAIRAGEDTTRQTGTMPVPTPGKGGGLLSRTGMFPTVNGNGLLSRTGMLPSITISTAVTPAAPTASMETPRANGGLLSRTGKFPQVGTGTGYLPTVTADSTHMTTATGQLPTATGQLATPTGSQPLAALPMPGQMSPVLNTSTGALTVPGQQGTNTVKLTGPVKVVQVPVPGQPGRYMTGLLPVVKQEEALPPVAPKKKMPLWVSIVSTLIAVILVLGASLGLFWYMHTHPTQSTQPKSTATKVAGTPNTAATAAALATATVEANTILSDSLSTNTHNWLTTPPDVYAFKDGAYHITDRGNSGRATVLQSRVFTEPLGYTLTMEEVAGDDTNATNSFGMIFRFNQQTKNNQTLTTFYSFEVVNVKGGDYQFWKYDDSQANKWTEVWHQPFGAEYHQGHGVQATNTAKIFANGSKFTITINGKQIATVQDASYTSGTVGMIVNLNGTEVAFKNMLLTRN